MRELAILVDGFCTRLSENNRHAAEAACENWRPTDYVT